MKSCLTTLILISKWMPSQQQSRDAKEMFLVEFKSGSDGFDSSISFYDRCLRLWDGSDIDKKEFREIFRMNKPALTPFWLQLADAFSKTANRFLLLQKTFLLMLAEIQLRKASVDSRRRQLQSSSEEHWCVSVSHVLSNS